MLDEKEVNPSCDLCHGTGEVGGSPCSCLRPKYGVSYVAGQFGVSRAALYRAWDRLAAKEPEIRQRMRQVRTPSMTS